MGSLHRYENRQPNVVAVTGEDAFSYLQSQFSHDLKVPAELPVTYGLFLDRKGKVKADAFILRTGEESFLMVSYHTAARELITIAEANVIADEVEFEDVSDDYSLVTLWGDETLLNAYLPTPGSYKKLEDALIFHGRRMNEPHVDCLVDHEETWPDEDDPSEDATDEDLLRIRVASCIPAIPQDVGPRDLPQEGGDLYKTAVNYTKGCYLGQEVMARLHAMGRAQRGLFRLNFATQSIDLPASVFAGEKEIGAITSAYAGRGLAILKRRYVTDDAELHIGSPDGESATVEAEISG